MPPRLTQRAPQSCTNCSKRKIKCDKRLPCSGCTRRGEASLCEREKVLVRGTLVNTQSYYKGFDYDALVLENLRLQSALLKLSSAVNIDADTSITGSVVKARQFVPDFSMHYHFNQLLCPYQGELHFSSVWNEDLVAFPTRELSMTMVDIAVREMSWYQFAIHYPSFVGQHEEFWARCGDQGSVEPAAVTQADAPWLAIYFGVIATVSTMLDETESLNLLYMSTSQKDLYIRNWVDSAMFFLAKADFLQVPHIQCVQAIIILKDVFTFEHQRRRLLDIWPVAISLARILGMDDEIKIALKSPLEAEMSRRIWWSLVASEWLLIPVRNTSIHAKDFNVDLPAVQDDAELSGQSSPPGTAERPRPIHYQLVLIRGAKINYEFYTAIASGTWSEENFVTLVERIDDRIAQIIAHLPDYLQGDYRGKIDADYPGIAQQRISIRLFLLEARVTTNELLAGIHSQRNLCEMRQRSICLGSSRTILQIALQASKAHLKIWYNVCNIFTALNKMLSVLLSGEKRSLETSNDIDLVRRGFQVLQSMQGGDMTRAALSLLETKIQLL